MTQKTEVIDLGLERAMRLRRLRGTLTVQWYECDSDGPMYDIQAETDATDRRWCADQLRQIADLIEEEPWDWVTPDPDDK